MPSALEQLRQGGGGVQKTSALDLLRQGGKEDMPFISLFNKDMFGTEITTPMFPAIIPSPLKTEEIVKGKELTSKQEELRIEAEKAEKEAGRPLFSAFPGEGRFGEAFKEQIKVMGQSIARSFLATGATIQEVSESSDPNIFKAFKNAIKTAEFKPETKFETALAGTTEPVSFESIGEETLSILGKDFAEKHKELALPVGLLIAGLDITPFGGTKRGAINAIKEANTIEDAIRVLTKMGVSDDLAREFAEVTVKAQTDDAARKLLDHIAKVETTTKATSRVAPQIISKPLGVESVKNIAPEVIPTLPKSILTPTVDDTIKKLTQALKEAKPVRKEQEELFATERARRTARVAAVGEKVKGEAGFFAQLGQLKGTLPKARFEAIRKRFSQNEIDSLFNLIEDSHLLPLEKVTTKGGLLNLFEGSVPTQSELRLLGEILPKEVVDEILAKRTTSEKIFGMIGQVINVPRAIMASVDLSAPLRQGIFLIGRPKRFISAFGNMFRYAFSEKAYLGLEQNIKSRKTYESMRRAKLALTELGSELTSREEAIMSNLPERIPFLGKVFRGSNRAYTGFLNKLRADVFDDIIKKSEKLSDEELKSIGKYVNAATGRGNLGELQRAQVLFNSIFFSPRLIASRINLLNPYFYITLSPVARREALKDGAKFAAITGTILALSKMGGAEVGVDPRSADFGKIKIGNTRIDIMGGFQQPIKLVAQLISGEIISSTTGRTITLGEGYKPLTRKDILLRFFENKESPIASFITGLLTNTTFTGEEFDVPSEVINRFIPMVIQDMYDLFQEKGAENLWMALPSIFGAGVQTYGKQELVFGESKIGEPTAQIQPTKELAKKIRELVLGQLPLGTSKSFSIEAYFDQLSNLPREEAGKIFDEIAKSNPELAKKLRDVVKERELGITVKDKDLKAKGVTSGDRALAIKEKLDELKTKEEKAALWNDYVKKGIITKEVSRQLLKLLK